MGCETYDTQDIVSSGGSHAVRPSQENELRVGFGGRTLRRFANRHTGASAALALAGALSVAPAAVAEAPSPIHITKCDVVPEEVPRHGIAQEAVRISFSIDGTTAADEAHFVASLGNNQLKGFIARGFFSGGVIIADRLLEANPAVTDFETLHGNLGCAATYVHFVNGSFWATGRSGESPSPPAR